ncbi:HAMP domain-containing protein [Streptomyces sp. NBC_01565]|nr:HAMP domain-containing protein [Streptomyces sp. NBC_01565]
MRRLRARLPARASTLTWKAAVFITLMCCGLAALLGGLVHGAMTHQATGVARDKALARLTHTVTSYEAGAPIPPGEGIDPAGLPGELRALAASGKRGTAVGEHRGKPAMWAAGPADHDGVIAAAVDYSGSERAIADLDRALVGPSVLAIGATLLIGAFGVTRITRRLLQTAQVARRITSGDLDARVNDAPRNRDEVAAVSGALDTMAPSLQRELEAEQRFTADVAHELRTPLTGLNAAAELFPPGWPAALVRDRVRAMRALTEDLLEISRLAGLVRPGRARGPRDPRVGDAHVAVGAGRGGRRGRGGRPRHTDRHRRGPGYPEYLLATGPRRFRTEGMNKGPGLGLTIAAGQSEALGATPAFHNPASGGAEARLRLPAPAAPAAVRPPRGRDAPAAAGRAPPTPA